MAQQQTHIHTNIDIANIRKPYKALHEYFDIEHLVSKEAIGQFKRWLEEAAEHVEEPNVASCFYWPGISRLISESNEYFQSRPVDSQISGAISPQSQAIPNREFLLQQRQHYIDNQIKTIGFRIAYNSVVSRMTRPSIHLSPIAETSVRPTNV